MNIFQLSPRLSKLALISSVAFVCSFPLAAMEEEALETQKDFLIKNQHKKRKILTEEFNKKFNTTLAATAVQTKMRQLGLPKKKGNIKRWSDEETESLAEFVAEELSQVVTGALNKKSYERMAKKLTEKFGEKYRTYTGIAIENKYRHADSLFGAMLQEWKNRYRFVEEERKKLDELKSKIWKSEQDPYEGMAREMNEAFGKKYYPQTIRCYLNQAVPFTPKSASDGRARGPENEDVPNPISVDLLENQPSNEALITKENRNLYQQNGNTSHLAIKPLSKTRETAQDFAQQNLTEKEQYIEIVKNAESLLAQGKETQPAQERPGARENGGSQTHLSIFLLENSHNKQQDVNKENINTQQQSNVNITLSPKEFSAPYAVELEKVSTVLAQGKETQSAQESLISSDSLFPVEREEKGGAITEEDFLKINKDMPRQELTKKFNEKFGTDFTLHGIYSKLKKYNLTKKRGEINQQNNIKNTTTEEDFLRINKDIPRQELTKAYNEKFPTKLSVEGVQGKMGQLGLTKKKGSIKQWAPEETKKLKELIDKEATINNAAYKKIARLMNEIFGTKYREEYTSEKIRNKHNSKSFQRSYQVSMEDETEIVVDETETEEAFIKEPLPNSRKRKKGDSPNNNNPTNTSFISNNNLPNANTEGMLSIMESNPETEIKKKKKRRKEK